MLPHCFRLNDGLLSTYKRTVFPLREMPVDSRGFRVAVNFVSNTNRVNEVVHEIMNNGGEAIAVKADVRQPGGAEQMVKKSSQNGD